MPRRRCRECQASAIRLRSVGCQSGSATGSGGLLYVLVDGYRLG